MSYSHPLFSIIDAIVTNQTKAFISHDIITILIKNHSDTWDNFVNQYTGNRRVQEQKAIQQIGCYLSRNANCLNLTKGEKIKPSSIIHKPQQTTKYTPNSN